MKRQFYIDANALEIGDIVLFADSKFNSVVIRAITRTDYSHAAICVLKGLLVEAQLEGIRARSTDSIRVERSSSLLVLRLRDEFDRSRAIRIRAGAIASGYLAKKYDHVGAIISPFPQLVWSEQENKVFCSQLVATAYEQAGLTLFNRNAEKIVPGSFASLTTNKDRFFEDVTSSVLVNRAALWAETVDKPALNWATVELSVFHRVLDDPEIIELTQQIFGRVPGSIWVLIDDLAQTPNETLDHQVAAILERNQYLEIVEQIEAKIGDPDVDKVAVAIKAQYRNKLDAITNEVQHLEGQIARLSALLDVASQRLIRYEDALKKSPASPTFRIFIHVTYRRREIAKADFQRLIYLYGRLQMSDEESL